MDKIETAINMIHTFKERYPNARVTIEASKEIEREYGKCFQTGVKVSVEFNHVPHEI